MRLKILFIICAVCCHRSSRAQGPVKLTGPLGVYHIAAGYSYSDSLGIDSTLFEEEFKFGELAIPNQSSDGRLRFHQQVDSSINWHTNRTFAIIEPPSEHGVYNRPADTSLFSPYPVPRGPGMIQGGQRFSRLSQMYSGFSGVILDDWNGDTSSTHRVYDAVHGKYVDGDGNVYSESVATTPYNKLYCVIYNTSPHTEALSYMDGVVYSYFQGQDCCYANLDSDIYRLRVSFPHKDITIAIFIQNSFLGWTIPESDQYMLAHALDRYDDGDINGLTLFAGSFLTTVGIPGDRWSSLALPHWLDSLYYPYLGQGQGKVYDCNTGKVLAGAAIHVFCEGRVSGDTLSRSNQRTDTTGRYSFGVWAGNRNTDSTYYWAIAEAPGYIPDTTGFWIKRLDTTAIPDISLCAAPDPVSIDDMHMLVYPNPTGSGFNIRVDHGNAIDKEVCVYNMMGEKVYSLIQKEDYSYIDLSMQPDGIYLVAIISGRKEISYKRVVLLRQ